MKFLVDQQLSRKLCRWIVSQGHDAEHVRDVGLEQGEDRDIWTVATQRGAVIVTKDEDFSVIASTKRGPQVVWIRVGNCSNEALLARLGAVWPVLMAEIEGGAALIEVR